MNEQVTPIITGPRNGEQAICPLFGAFYPYFAIHSTLRAAGASRYPPLKEREWPRSLS